MLLPLCLSPPPRKASVSCNITPDPTLSSLFKFSSLFESSLPCVDAAASTHGKLVVSQLTPAVGNFIKYTTNCDASFQHAVI